MTHKSNPFEATMPDKNKSKADRRKSEGTRKKASSPPPPPQPRRERRALSHVGGAVRCLGPATELYPVIEWALKVSSDEKSVRDHVHGFHSYPARLHPVTARRLIEKLSQPGDTILDPFCGSGTVLVEALLQGRDAVGIDLNPLACELARFKTKRTTAAERTEWMDAAERVSAYAEDRRQLRLGPTRTYLAHERAPYDPHILFELDGLSAGIVEEPEAIRQVLRLILSSILTKVSRSLGDSSGKLGPRRLASGFAIRAFLFKVKEVCRQSAQFAKLIPPGVGAQVVLTDARRLTGVDPASIDLVVSSPPYPGVFDYLTHHSHRLHWLGLDASQLARNEIGSRRQLGRMEPQVALERWRGDFGAALRTLARVVKPKKPVALVIADSALGDFPLRTDQVVTEIAQAAGFELGAIGSQERPHFHDPTRRAFKGEPRYEHLLVLRRKPAMPVRIIEVPSKKARSPSRSRSI
ncbi:MAG TPA: DNA methyltransferase [Polyangiaceae bacterium]|nr:DNA methyltransferase [Polyangiaceae bacterium]